MGQENRTIQEVKDKSKNLHSTAKKEFSSFKRDSRKTGGGPPPKPPTQSSEQIIEILENTPAFSGLCGFETCDDEGAGKWYANFVVVVVKCKTGHVISLKLFWSIRHVQRSSVLRYGYKKISNLHFKF